MKKIVILNLCLICSIFTVQAQNSVIVKEGFHLSNQILTTSETSTAYDYILGLSAGAAYRAELGKGFAIQPELSLLQKGSSVELDRATTQTTNMLYVEVPILLVYQPVKTNNFGISLFGGPTMSLGLLGNIELDDKTTTIHCDEINSLNWGEGGFSRTEFSWTFGTDIQFRAGLGKVVIDFRYLMGRSNIRESVTKSANGTLRNNGFGLSVGYAYPLGIQQD